MSVGNAAGRYQKLRGTGRVLGRMSSLVTVGVWALGLSLFLDQARDLISDGQFTWGERQVMAVIAVVTLGSSLVGGWVVGRFLHAAADLIEIVADLGDSSWRTGDLVERHVIPLLGRIATNLEQASPPNVTPASPKLIRPATSQTISQADPNPGRAGR